MVVEYKDKWLPLKHARERERAERVKCVGSSIRFSGDRLSLSIRAFSSMPPGGRIRHYVLYMGVRW